MDSSLRATFVTAAGLLACAAATADADPSRWEGAIGLAVSNGAAYLGADERGTKANPVFYLRRGRFSISSGSGFVTRQNQDVVRGLGVDLVQREGVRVSLGLRYDGGRSESTADALAGLGDVKSTLRARIAASWRLDRHWKLGASWTVDTFGRGGGNFGEVDAEYEQPVGARTVWASDLALSLAGDRYMQSYFGITPEQSARTGYPVYEPGFGLRELTLSTGLRTEFTPRWSGTAGVAVTRVLGPAADSPLTRRRTTVGASAAIAWRF